MDVTPLTKKAPPAAAGGALPSSAAQQAVEPSSPSPDDTAPARAVAGRVKTTSSGAGEDDDEQVERFYALLDNIRAMRGMLGTGATATAPAAAGRKKRAREAEPPWRPAFRMEDFELEEVQSDAPCCDVKRKKTENRCGARRLPAAARRETTGEEEEEEEEGEILEAKAPRREQHKARRAGVLAVGRLGRR